LKVRTACGSGWLNSGISVDHLQQVAQADLLLKSDISDDYAEPPATAGGSDLLLKPDILVDRVEPPLRQAVLTCCSNLLRAGGSDKMAT
jgi:hypothetical protein